MAHIVRGRLASNGLFVALHIKNGTVVHKQVLHEEGRVEEHDSLWIADGFVDHQVNGFAGYDVQKAHTDHIVNLTKALWKTGVVAYCPTVITNDKAGILEAIRAIVLACEQDALINFSIPAIHVEGPFISPIDGPRGAHNKHFVRPPDWDEFLRWQEAAEGRIGIVTLSPEWPEAFPFIEKLRKEGVIAAIGHTSARPEQIRAAVQAGAKLSTHLGNGAHVVLPRHPNYIWEQLAQDDLMAGLIVDGHHLAPSVVKTMIRAKGLSRVALTTDAVAMAGLPPGRYTLNGIPVEMKSNGRIEVVDGDGVLAGSVLDMPTAIANTMRFAHVSLAEAVQLATTQPARLLGLHNVNLRLGQPATMTTFRISKTDGSLRIRSTYVDGERVYHTSEV